MYSHAHLKCTCLVVDLSNDPIKFETILCGELIESQLKTVHIIPRDKQSKILKLKTKMILPKVLGECIVGYP